MCENKLPIYVMSSKPRHNPGRTAAATEHLSTSPADHQHACGSCHVFNTKKHE